jgi:hypothetical protein
MSAHRWKGLVGVAALLIGAACTGASTTEGRDRPAAGASTVAPTGPAAGPVCSLPAEWLLRIRRGYDPERSGEIQMLPRQPNVMGDWLSHAGPWPLVQRVPLFLYGPGHVPAVGRVDPPATLADLAPTLARLLQVDFEAPDGHALRAALPANPPAPPRLILTVIWDSAGRNVLAEHPGAWPTLRRLIPRGVWFDRATVGTSPSTTPAVHATIGTGAFPRRHGLVDLRFRLDGRIAWIGNERPAFERVPTLADRYAASTGQTARVGLVASLGTLGMIGHGAAAPGGGRHVVAMWGHEGRWEIGRQYADDFRFPEYVNDVGGLEEAVRRLDLEDGRLDGSWLGERVLDDPTDLSFSPAFAEYQTGVLDRLIRREGFGRDDVPDLLFTNYKQIDTVGHRWTMNSPQMEAVVRSSDAALRDLVGILDRTADHGSIPDPALTGATVIAIQELANDLRRRFDPEGADRSVLEQTRPTQLWIDEDLLRERGFTLEDVAAFVRGYRRGQNVEDPSTLAPGEPDERLFETAFPSSALERMPCVPDV